MSGDRAFFKLDFGRIDAKLAEILSRYHSSLRTDISRYYPSIYTHAIAWAIYGKDAAKADLHTQAFKDSLGSRLDELVRKGQDQQSVGIPIGPDTSRVIGEIVGVAIERAASTLIPGFADRAFRYVDDIVVGYDAHQSPQALQAALLSAFSQYELDINLEKTKILGAAGVASPEWISTLRRYRITSSTSRPREVIEDFFKSAMYTYRTRTPEKVFFPLRSRNLAASLYGTTTGPTTKAIC
jgi:hypothetical protein